MEKPQPPLYALEKKMQGKIKAKSCTDLILCMDHTCVTCIPCIIDLITFTSYKYENQGKEDSQMKAPLCSKNI